MNRNNSLHEAASSLHA